MLFRFGLAKLFQTSF
jgi:hypothetical protein